MKKRLFRKDIIVCGLGLALISSALVVTVGACVLGAIR